MGRKNESRLQPPGHIERLGPKTAGRREGEELFWDPGRVITMKLQREKEILEFFPGFNLHKGIPSQDEEEGDRILFSEIPDRINGVRFSRSFKFNVGGGEMGVRRVASFTISSR